MDEVRVSNNARYTATFTAFGQGGGTIGSPTAFTSDSNTKLLIHSNTSNGSVVFTDSSPVAAVAGKVAQLNGWAVNY